MEALISLIRMSHDRPEGRIKDIDDGIFRVYSNGKITYSYRCPLIGKFKENGIITKVIKPSSIPNIHISGLFPLEVSNEYGVFGYAIVSLEKADKIRESLRKLFDNKPCEEIKDEERIRVISIARRSLFIRNMATRLSHI